MSFTYQETVTISGFAPQMGVEGSPFEIQGAWLRDVDEVHFIDQFDQRTQVVEWQKVPDPAFVGSFVEASMAKDGFIITGLVPGTLPKTDIEKFPRFRMEISNNVSSYTKCCYEIRKDLYNIYDDVVVDGNMSFSAPVAEPGINSFLVRGNAGGIFQRDLETFLTGVNHALVSELALSVEMNWTEFSGQFVTTETMDTRGNVTNTEGVEIASIWVEPLKSDTYLLIDVDLCVTATELTDIACAIFRGNKTSPEKMWSQSVSWPDQMHTLRLRHIARSEIAGIRQEYQIRVGVAKPSFYNYRGQKVYINRCNGTITKQPEDIFGDKATSVVWIREMKHNPEVPI